MPGLVDCGALFCGDARDRVQDRVRVDAGGGPGCPGTPTPTTIDTTRQLAAVACPSSTQCTAIDNNGQQVTFDPTSPGTPTPTAIDTGHSLAAVACPSSTQCTAVDVTGQQVTFDPANPGTPTPTTIDTGNALTGVIAVRKRSPSQLAEPSGSSALAVRQSKEVGYG